MKKLSLVFALLVMASLTVNAQGKRTANATAKTEEKAKAPTPEDVAKKQVDDMDKLVSLSDEQKTSIYNVYLTLAHRAKTINEGNAAEKETHLKQLEEFRLSTTLQNLNPDQQKKYKEAVSKK